MHHIRIRLTLKLNGDHTLNQDSLNALKADIERGVATNLPSQYNVDTCKVTRINEAKPSTITENAE